MDKDRERIRQEIFGKHEENVAHEQSEGNGISEISSGVNPGLLRMFPPRRLKRIMEKEARKYKQALEKKWANWFGAVSK